MVTFHIPLFFSYAYEVSDYEDKIKNFLKETEPCI